MLRTHSAFEKPVFIINPNSANGSTRKEWPGIEAVARQRFPKLEVRFTTKPYEAPALAARAIHEGADLVVSVGGDGTHNEVVNGFFENEKVINPATTLGILARGTGGDFRRTLGFGRCRGAEMAGVVNQLGACRTTACDVGKLRFVANDGTPTLRYFINITSFGIGGEVDKRVNESSKALGGKASFFLGSLKASLAYKNRRVRVSVDGQPFYEGPMYNIAVANGRFFGGGMMVAPQAEIDDGLFDVVACGDLGFIESLTLARNIYSGKHLELPKVKMARGRTVVAESDERVLLDVDGEAPGRLNAQFENVHAAIRVLRI